MSATGRGGERRKGDAYYTPDDLAAACVRLLPLRPGDYCLEPSAGGGAFVRALLPVVRQVKALDIDADAPAVAEFGAVVGDFFGLGHDDQFDWVVGNPPYKDATYHIEHACALARVGVAFVLRLNILGSIKRQEFWRKYPPAEVHVLTPRPSFTGGGSDATEYGFFVWRMDEPADSRLLFTQWR